MLIAQSILLGIMFFGLLVVSVIFSQMLWAAIPWQVKHKILGWHFVLYRDSATQFPARVVKLPSGEIWMKGGYCRSHYDAKINEDLTLDDVIRVKVKPLTW